MRVRMVHRVMVGLVAAALGGMGAIPQAASQTAGKTNPNAVLSVEPPATSEVEQAAKLFRSGDYEGTKKVLLGLAQKHPDMPPPEVVMAGWFLAANQMALARAALERAVASVPNDPEAYQVLGDLAMRNRQTTEAGVLFEKVYSMTRSLKDPSPRMLSIRRRALAGLAAVAEERQDWASAQSHLEALLAEEPKNAGALQQLGRVLFMQKKEDLALQRLREATKLDENLLNAEATLAQLCQQAGDIKSAGKWMVEAIKASPRDPKVRVAAAQWSYQIGKLDQAEEQAKAAVTLDPDSLACQLIRGTVALVRKDYATAQQFLEKAHLQAPTDFNATNNLALALAGQEEESKRRLALEYAQINARVYPDQSDALSTLGWALYRLGRLDEAEANLRRAVTLLRPSPDTFYYLARVLFDRGRKEDAKMLLQSPAMKTSAPYLMRKEAEALLEELAR